MPPVLKYVRNGNKENALHALFQSFLFLFVVSILCGCGSFSPLNSVEELEDSGHAIESPQAKEEKIIPEARFLYDLTFQKSILSTCNQKEYSYESAYETWYRYSDCKFGFHESEDYRTSLNVHVESKGDSISAVSYMELPVTKSGLTLIEMHGKQVINTKDKYCSVYGIDGFYVMKVVKPALCEALSYEHV